MEGDVFGFLFQGQNKGSFSFLDFARSFGFSRVTKQLKMYSLSARLLSRFILNQQQFDIIITRLNMILKSLQSAFSRVSTHRKNQGISLLSNLREFQNSISQEHFFVRKNNKQIGQQIETLIYRQNWQLLRRALNLINISELDSWLIIRKIAIALQTTLNKELQISHLQSQQIEDILTSMVKLNFQPVQNPSPSYDSNQSLRQQLEHYIKEVQQERIGEHYMKLVNTLLHTNPSFFANKKIEIQNLILNNLTQFEQSGSVFTQLLTKGAISNFWSDSFKKKLQKKVQKIFLHPFYFSELSYPTVVKPKKDVTRVKTEIEIANILEGYHYDFATSMNINGYEVDFILSNLMVIQYNGYYHYAINSEKMIPTRKEIWRKNVLNKRGFAVCSLPYDQWKFLKSFEEKRQYLVVKIQNELIELGEKGIMT